MQNKYPENCAEIYGISLLVHFYPSIRKYHKGKLRKQSHKIPRNKFNEGCKTPTVGIL